MTKHYIIALCLALACTHSQAADYVLYSTTAPAGGIAQTTGLRVRYIDYDGTILSTVFVDSGANATPPADPSRALLTFTGWNLASTNITQDTDIGATYATTDGKTYVYLTVTTITTTNCTLYLNKSDTSTVSIAWGDGVTTTHTNSGNFNTGAHAYPSNGYYVATIWISTGSGTYGLGNGASSTAFVGGNTQANKDMMTSCLIGTSVTNVGANAFANCRALSSLAIPIGVTNVGASAFVNCYSLGSLSLPSGVITIGASAFDSCYNLCYLAVPESSTSIGVSAFSGCYALSSLAIPSGVTSIGTSAFADCRSLRSIVIPSGVTSIGTIAFNGCYVLSSLAIPSGVTSIGERAFSSCFANRYYNLQPTNPPALGATPFTSINSSTKIFVPDAYYSVYTNAAGWSNSPIPVLYIYPVSTKP